MLLRSSSTPIMRSWIPPFKEACIEHDFVSQVHRRQSSPISASSSSVLRVSHAPHSASGMMNRASSETDLHRLMSNSSISKEMRKSSTNPPCDFPPTPVEECAEEWETAVGFASPSLDRLFSSSGLDELVESCVETEEAVICPLTLGGDCAGGDGGAYGGRGRGDDGGDSHGVSGYYDSNDRRRRDAFYRRTIEAHPENSLLLVNYAKFLKEVQGDLPRAEEYCERAILANPGDGDVLALYANIIWEVHRDAARADSYFNQAIQAAPDNCFVMASYARFMWDAGEEEEVIPEATCEDVNLQSGLPKRGPIPQLPSPMAAAY